MITSLAGVWEVAEHIITRRELKRIGQTFVRNTYMLIYWQKSTCAQLTFRLCCSVFLRFSSDSHTQQEWMSTVENCKGPPPPPPFPDFITCSLILFLCSHKHDTKPAALLFTVDRGRLALSWMGWIRYVLHACVPALSLSHSGAVLQGTNMATRASGTAWPGHCIYK